MNALRPHTCLMIYALTSLVLLIDVLVELGRGGSGVVRSLLLAALFAGLALARARSAQSRTYS